MIAMIRLGVRGTLDFKTCNTVLKGALLIRESEQEKQSQSCVVV